MGSRNLNRGKQAIDSIIEKHPEAKDNLELVEIDVTTSKYLSLKDRLDISS